jgi:lysozyme
MIYDALEISVELCKRFEGFRAKPYLCPAGVPTIGYGATYYFDGTKVTLEDPPVEEIVAEELLREMLGNIYMVGIFRVSPKVIGNANILAALTDFAYNLGVPRYRASTLRKRIDIEDWERAATEIRRWNRGGGRILKGLVLRREAEAQLILRG